MLCLSWRPYLLVLLFLCLAGHLNTFDVIVGNNELVYNGFPPDMNLGGQALWRGNFLSLTGALGGTSGHVFCSYPLSFQNHPGSPISSFSTTFVFVMDFNNHHKGNGLTFMLSSTSDLPDNLPGQYLGLPYSNSDVHVFFAVEFDTVLNPEFGDIDNNHVGVDFNSLVSVESQTAGFYDYIGEFQTIVLESEKTVQSWVDYDSKSHQLNVTLAPCYISKPQIPLLSTTVNLSSLLSLGPVYAGFSASSGKGSSGHYVLGWSLKLDGVAQPLDYTVLSIREFESHGPNYLIRGAPSIVLAVFLIVLAVLICRHLRKAKEDDDWEIKCGMPSFTYKDLVTATEGFSNKMLLGKGGFGRVYKGVLPTTTQHVAIKRVSPESKQGKKEFMAEIAILGHVRHRNLVQLLGYCRYKQELLLVYDYMPNGSLDKYLYDKNTPTLDWARRLHIIKGVASGIFYLHEDWEQVIIHRDIKASNVLLDDDMNGRLGDFGLARLHDHGVDAHTTHVAGTWGYIAPELARLGKATKATDVFAFGVFIIEVVCGRKPIGPASTSGDLLALADWVRGTWQGGSIIDAVDSELKDYDTTEVELVLKLGLLCSHSLSRLRPCMRLVMLYLEGGARLVDFQPASLVAGGREDEKVDEAVCASSATTVTIISGR
ncbi:L-type lectin-domain containing receptor kinase IV.2-like [Hordeum vulgare subsp. vulgare]|uniref:Protein kinase domain-containing protein n=1 Tax=Hordeum vulgare subsp. vulgare TaxID=112509 RepID=A0A8I6YXC9_HORVV|nr:L-type lectin-domain containing receptor kinase IV.2-like [Hordeum vulgare subsp. vulgare]